MGLPTLTFKGPYDATLRVNPSWLVTVLLILLLFGLVVYPQQFDDLAPGWLWLTATAATVLYFSSLLLHEIGHAAAAWRMGIPIHGIELHLFGGVVHIRSIPRHPWEELLLALSGPLVSLVLSWLFIDLALLLGFFESRAAEVMATVSVHLAVYNAAALALNLIPVYPLDGGRALRAVIWWMTRSFRLSITLALALSLSLLGLLAGLGLVLPLPNALFNASILMLVVFVGRVVWQGHWWARRLVDHCVGEVLDEEVRILRPGDDQAAEDQVWYTVRCDAEGRPLAVVWHASAADDPGDATHEVTADDTVTVGAVAIDAMPRLQSRARPWLVAVDDQGRCQGLVSRERLEQQLAGL